MQLVEAAAQLICRSGSERNGTNLSAKIPDAARINTHSTTSEKREEFRPLPLKGREFVITELKLVPLGSERTPSAPPHHTR